MIDNRDPNTIPIADVTHMVSRLVECVGTADKRSVLDWLARAETLVAPSHGPSAGKVQPDLIRPARAGMQTHHLTDW